MLSAQELEQCTTLLSRLSPDDFLDENVRPELVDLRNVGRRLFGPAALQERFGQADVVTYLKEKNRHQANLKKLEKLQRSIAQEHERMRSQSAQAQINRARDERFAAIEAAALKSSPALEDARAPALLGAANVAGETAGEAAGEAAEATGEATGEAMGEAASLEDRVRQTAELPLGSFRRRCGVCKCAYSRVDSFYHQLCPVCAELNLAKRHQSAPMRDMVAIVTGGRVRIGYRIVLKLLRAGAYVLTTTRFPADAAARFAAEVDFDAWSSRLEICGPLELTDVRAVERFCEQVLRRLPRIHVLINNAAQTLTRDAGWYARMDSLEESALQMLPAAARALLSLPGGAPASLCAPDATAEATARASLAHGVNGSSAVDCGDAGGGTAAVAALADAEGTACGEARCAEGGGGGGSCRDGGTTAAGCAADGAGAANGGRGTGLVESSTELVPVAMPMVAAASVRAADLSAEELAPFPEGRLDESAQPLDLSSQNSWSRRLGQVSTGELLHTMAANAIAPFVLCSRLGCALAPAEGDDDWGHVINVSALEGKFSVGKKSGGHPHTNMAKAALNMLTCTSAGTLARERILINCVDTGWVTDMAPGGVGAKASIHATHVAPPLDEEDGAARVLDPVFSHINDTSWRTRGKFFKDYKLTPW